MKKSILPLLFAFAFASADTTYIFPLSSADPHGQVKTWLWSPNKAIGKTATVTLRETAVSPVYMAQLKPASIPDSISCLLVASTNNDSTEISVTSVFAGFTASVDVAIDTSSSPKALRLPFVPGNSATITPVVGIGDGDTALVKSLRCW